MSTKTGPSMTDPMPPTAPMSPGSEAAAATRGNALPIGTRLREFEVLNVVGEGGFGIVYLAQDHTLGRLVALKEFMPASLAVRTQGLAVQVRQGARETYDLGLRSFVNEARLLAQFDLPTVVRVYQFWEDNGTAYIVMPFYRGALLSDWINAKARREPLPCDDEVWLRKHFLAPVLGALDTLHAVQCYHRDLAPDNILLSEDGQKPVLLDFGAARHVIGNATQKLTAFVKPGYAPIEQYGEIGDIAAKQGPWTDIYGLAAVLYHLIAGSPPAAAPTRLLRDPMPALITIGRGRYTDQLLSAIDAGLAIRPEHRPQSISLWRAILGDNLQEGSGGAGSRLALVDYEEARPAGPSGVPAGGPGGSASAGTATPGARKDAGAGASGWRSGEGETGAPAAFASSLPGTNTLASATGAPSALNLDFSSATSRVLGRTAFMPFEAAAGSGTAPASTPNPLGTRRADSNATRTGAAAGGQGRTSAAGEPSRFFDAGAPEAQAAPASLYTHPPVDMAGETTRQMRHLTDKDESSRPDEVVTPEGRSEPGTVSPVPSPGSALRRHAGLRSTLGWIGLVCCFTLASALWLVPERWLPGADSGLPAATSPSNPGASAPVAGAETGTRAGESVIVAGTALAAAADDAPSMCASVLQRAAESLPISDEELIRYERDCIR